MSLATTAEGPSATSLTPLAETISRHKAGESVGVYSVCSAHPTVVEAAIAQAAADGGYVLIEATSNQVDQFGGYTGLRPADFRDLVLGIADRAGFARERVVLGGDHLGPNRWQRQAAEPGDGQRRGADRRLRRGRLHQDSPRLQHVVRRRSRGPCRRGRGRAAPRDCCGWPRTAARPHRFGRPGVRHRHRGARPRRGTRNAERTRPDARPTAPSGPSTPTARRSPNWAWPTSGQGSSPWWCSLASNSTTSTSSTTCTAPPPSCGTCSTTEPNLVFEAHSTDYQRPAQLRELVEDHWAVLKVGPGLTFAMREALFALARIEAELAPGPSESNLIEVIERRMLADPTHWQDYYEGDPLTQRTARRYSYSDRLRYYWADEQIEAARLALLTNLDRIGIPLPLISQFLPDAVRPDTQRSARTVRAGAGHRPGA